MNQIWGVQIFCARAHLDLLKIFERPSKQANLAESSKGELLKRSKVFLFQIKQYLETRLPYWSSLIRRKTDWSKSKKETKLVALRDKKENAAQMNLAGPNFFEF